MKTYLAENLKRLRKENGLTQEELAERINVSPGVISKWERGTSEPDLSSLLLLAKVFKSSVDAILEYSVENEDPMKISEEILSLKREIKIKEAVELANEALLKYPNHLGVVYAAATLFHISKQAGYEDNTERAIELFKKAITLLPQDTKKRLSETELNNEISLCLMELGRYDEAIELLKENNICGINCDLLGSLYIHEKEDYELGIEYLSKSSLILMDKYVRVVVAFGNAYLETKRYKEAVLVFESFDTFVKASTIDKRKNTFLDKIDALVLAGASMGALGMKDEKKAKNFLIRAYECAKRYDEIPIHSMKNLLLVGEVKNGGVAFDDTGDTAMGGVYKTLSENENHTLLKMWKEIVDENQRTD